MEEEKKESESYRKFKKTNETIEIVQRSQAFDTLQTLAGYDHAEGGDMDSIRDMIDESYGKKEKAKPVDGTGNKGKEDEGAV
ncbi:MAG: hypothetical protein KGH53_03730, partial [Candidatus Micrarchaeota archaeon]|nr:hypothetical protein [Candidatus Micrarchaeota archaeon]